MNLSIHLVDGAHRDLYDRALGAGPTTTAAPRDSRMEKVARTTRSLNLTVPICWITRTKEM